VTNRSVAVVADSAANVPPALAAELSIGIVPLYLRFGEAEYRDGVDMAPRDFYQRLVDGGERASTSTPSPGDFLEAYERARRRTGVADLVCVTVASTMSGANHEAGMGAEGFDGTVDVVDSLSASMAEGFVAIEAARLAAAGAPLADVAARAREVAGRTVLFATVDTFEFLRRSGRVTKLQAYAATMLDIKPVFAFRDGEAQAVARPRTRRRAIDRVAQETLGAAEGRPFHLAVIHASAAAEAQDLADRIEREAGPAAVLERVVVEVTPVIGAHTGPGLVGTAILAE
jgi:fatty acid kinase fatty acid binding subunit